MNPETSGAAFVAGFYIIHVLMFTYLMSCGTYLLLSKRSAFVSDVVPNPQLRKITGFNLYLWSVTYISAIIWFNLPIEKQPYFEHLFIMLDLMIIPPTAHLVLSILQHPRTRYWLMIPQYPIAFILFLSYALSHNTLTFYLYIFTWIGYCIIFLIVLKRYVKRYNKLLKERYSNLENKTVGWMMNLGWYFAVFFTLYIVHHIIHNHLLAILTYAACITLWSYICWNVERQQRLKKLWDKVPFEPEIELGMPQVAPTTQEAKTEDSKSVAPEAPKKATASTSDPVDLEWVGDLLKKRCEEAKIYLEADLTLDSCARHVGTNRTYISRYLAHHGHTYYSYINKLRIDHALNLLKESGEGLSYNEIALKSGYRNINTFRRAFKDVTGMLPSQYLDISNKHIDSSIAS